MQNNFDPIDPAKVVMDNEPIDPAKVVMDNDSIYTTTAADLKRVRMAFVADDPLGFIANPDERFYIQNATETFPDRDEYRKRLALAAYFTANNKGADYRFVLGNLDGIIEQFYKKKTSVDTAFADIAQMYKPQVPWWADMVGKKGEKGENFTHIAALGAGAADFASRMAATSLRLAKWDVDLRLKILSPFLPETAEKNLKKYLSDPIDKFAKEWVIKNNNELIQDLDAYSGANPNFLTDMILGDFDKVSVTDFTKALIRSFPDMAFQLGLAVAAPYAVPVVVGTQTAAMKDYEVDEKHPDWGSLKRLSYIGFHAVSEALLETVTAKIAGGVLTREAAAEILAKGMWKYLGTSFGKESGTEAFQQLFANSLDLLYNIDGDRQKLSGSQIMGKLFQGFLESGFVGGVYGLPFGYAGFRNTRQLMGAAESTRQKHQEKVRVLASKETLSEMEKVQLQVSQDILDNNSPQEILALDHVADKMAEANSDEEIRNGEEYQEVLSTSAPGTSEEQISAAVRAQRNLAFKDTADYDLGDVYSKVQEIAADFPSVEFVTLDNWGQLPDSLRAAVRNRGRGFFDPAEGKVYINASRVRPHEVLELMLHEAVGHKGLRAVVPGEQLDQLLDKVYAAHFNDEEFQKIASRYFPENIQSLTDENGEEYFGVSLENVEQQREAAEEYIAHIAQKGVPKPSWWKQFLQQIRMLFGKFKWAEDAVLLDSQIETVLALAAKKVRKAGVKEYLTTGSGLRFAETDDYGQPYYDIPFGKSVDAVINDTYTGDGSVFMCNTPELFVTMGFSKLPIMTTAKHIKSIYSPKQTDADHNHDLGDLIKQIPEKLENPLMVITSKTHPDTSVVVMLDFTDKNNNTIVVPILLDGTSQRGKINAHIMTSAQGRSNAFTELAKNAVDKENKGVPSILYAQKKSESIANAEGVQFPNGFAFDSVNHNITDVGLKVKSQTETLQFKKWFARSKVVDKNGNPLVVYHGSSADFTVFDHRFAYRNGAAEGRGFYFTSDKSKAEGYKTDNGKLFEVYLRLQKPLDPDKLTITKEEVEKIIRSIDTDGMYVSYYAEDDRGYPGKIWHNKAVKSAVNAIYDSSDNNADIVAEIYSVFGQGDALAKITEATGYDGFVKDDVFVVFNPTQIKSATDNIGTFDPENPDIRFSLEEYSESEQDDIVAVLQPFVGRNMDMEPEKYREYLRSKGIQIPDQDADIFFRMAVMANDKAARERANRLRDQWIFENFPIFAEVAEFAGGSDFKIKPVGHEGEDFTGSYISPAYVKYSVKASQGKRSEKKYRQYLADRKERLKNAEGVDIDELASAIARKLDQDHDEVKDQIIDFFRHLKKKDLISQYSQFKKDALALDKEAEKQAREEFMQQERYRIEDEVVRILTAGEPIDQEWITDNPKVFKELYRRIFNGKEAPATPSNIDLEAVNAALTQEGSTESFGPGYKEGKKAAETEFRERLKAQREKDYEEYLGKLRDIQEQLLSDMVNVLKLQKDAADFAAKHLPKENRGEFTKSIVKLLELSPRPSGKYPEGHRKAAFDQLIVRMTERAAQTRRDDIIASIHNLLDRNKTRRTEKGVPYSPMGERQPALDRIAQVSRMNPETILLLQSYAAENVERLQEDLDRLMDKGEIEEKAGLEAELKRFENDLFYLEHFGNLAMKTPEALQKSLEMLRGFIKGGRDEFRTFMEERAARIREERELVRLEMTKGDLSIPSRNTLDLTANRVKETIISGLSDTQLVREFSRLDNDVEFFQSEHGKLLSEIEKSTQVEETFKRKAQEKINDFYNENGLNNLVERGKFLRQLKEEVDSGIVVPLYGRIAEAAIQPANASPDAEPVTFSDFSKGRPTQSAFVYLEHGRRMLEDINQGVRIKGVLRTGNIETARELYKDLKSSYIFRNYSENNIITDPKQLEDVVKFGKRFTVAVTEKGFRVYVDSNENDIISFDLDKPTPVMEDLLKDKKNIFPMDEFAIASGRAKISEFDAGTELSQHSADVGDDIDAAAMKAYFATDENARNTQKIRLEAAEPNVALTPQILRMSPGQAVQIILTYEQPGYKTNMHFNGFDDAKINEIKEWVQKSCPGALEFGYALRDIVAGQREQLDKAVFDRFGVHLPDQENFWYADFSSSNRTQVQDAGYGNPTGGMTVSSNFLTARRYHTLPVNIKSDFLSVFMRKQPETAHFIAWSQTVRDLRAIYSDLGVQNILIKEFGIDAWNVWKKRIELLAAGGGEPASIADNIANYINESFFPANIALNLKSVVSQLAGGTSYALYVPPNEMLKRFNIDRDTEDYRKFIAMVNKSGYLKNRADGGFDPTLRSLADIFRKKKVSPLADDLLKKSLALTTWADRQGSLFWGYMAYDYFKKQGISKGMPQEEAENYAFEMWKRATDETQQSGAMKDRNSFNINPGLLRAITAYMTSPMQQLGLEISSIRRYMKDKTEANKKEMLRRIIVNHLIVTTSMNLIASAFRHGVNFADYLDDWPDYVFGWLFGSLDAFWFFGKTIKGVFTDNYFDMQPKSLMPALDNVARDYQKISKDIQGKSEINPLDYLQATGDLLMSAGPPITRTAGIGLYVASREIKRFMRFFEDK